MLSHLRLDEHKILRAAMERISDQDGEMLVGERYKDFRADFAADVDAQMFFPMKGDEEPFREFASELQSVVRRLIRYVRAAIDKYLLDREDFLTVEEYDDWGCTASAPRGPRGRLPKRRTAHLCAEIERNRA